MYCRILVWWYAAPADQLITGLGEKREKNMAEVTILTYLEVSCWTLEHEAPEVRLGLIDPFTWGIFTNKIIIVLHDVNTPK